MTITHYPLPITHYPLPIPQQLMDFSAALPTFVITLREGVEAALVVGIVLAWRAAVQVGRQNQYPPVFPGNGCLAALNCGGTGCYRAGSF